LPRVKPIAAASILLLLSAAAFGLEFRKTSWMMSRTEVMAAEPGTPVSVVSQSGQCQITFQASVNGFPARITYVLENDRLLAAFCEVVKDADRRAFDAMRRELAGQRGKPSFEKPDLVGWRLDLTEIALSHLPDGRSCAAYWEKAYFASINGLKAGTATK
jgi:hypothetical protein